jgi:hypothetical protein
MYNHNLEMMQTFGQEDSMLPFYFSHDIIFFFTSDQYFISFKQNFDQKHYIVTIINRSNGLIESSFNIFENVNHLRLYLDKFLITFDQNTCSLKCYNFKGDLLAKINLDEKFRGSQFYVLNKELCFFLLGKYFIF